MIKPGQLYCCLCGQPNEREELRDVPTAARTLTICERCYSDPLFVNMRDQEFWERRGREYKEPAPCPFQLNERVTLWGKPGRIVDINPGGVLFQGDDHGSYLEGKRWNQVWIPYDQPHLKSLRGTRRVDWDARERGTSEDAPLIQLELF